MQAAVSTAGVVDVERPRGGVSMFCAAGFKAVEIDFLQFYDAAMPEEGECFREKAQNAAWARMREIRENPRVLAAYAEALFSACRSAGLSPAIARAPFRRHGSGRSGQEGLLLALAKECVGICGKAGCFYLVVRPLEADDGRGGAWEANRAFYLELARAAEGTAVQILLENECAVFSGRLVRGVCAEPEEAAAWIDRLNAAAGAERFGFCFDVGAANLCGQDMRESIVTLGNRVKAVRMRDCDGRYEASLLPFTALRQGCLTDWRSVVWGLREIDFDGLLLYDIAGTASAFPVLLRPYVLTLAQKTAAYFDWVLQIEAKLQKYRSIVLFGAGNMCKNYMAFYGEKYPPLFTCDNDRSLWGTRVHGLLVKPPEALQTLPAGCGVFVCNMYYREIERQLKEMGVGPVAFFNDEYLPPQSWAALKEDGQRC